ncbi:MAG: phosphotransferase [Hamadaea sp.]|nr:phosphotransferase [Hamadaea sp.]
MENAPLIMAIKGDSGPRKVGHTEHRNSVPWWREVADTGRVDDQMIGYARKAFGWTGDVAVSAGPRGALGQIWRVDTGGRSFALKELFTEPKGPIEPELDFVRRATAAGVKVPLAHPDRDGNYLVESGKWLRLYDWVDLRPVDLTPPETPRRLGELFARLHRCAPPMTGAEVHPWYRTVPAQEEWTALLPAAGSFDGLADIPLLSALVTAPKPEELILCHRDLHPENVLEDPTGELVVIDWDNIGPATPAREIAQALFDWYCDPEPDLTSMRAMYKAYVDAGGSGRLTSTADFTMLVAVRLNFLLLQSRIALDPETEPQHREWAEREVEEAQRILPTPRHFTDVLRALR